MQLLPMQSHGCVLHVWFNVRSGQVAPLSPDCKMTVRVCVVIPPPQVAEQGDDDDHELTTQSTGHDSTLQVTL